MFASGCTPEFHAIPLILFSFALHSVYIYRQHAGGVLNTTVSMISNRSPVCPLHLQTQRTDHTHRSYTHLSHSTATWRASTELVIRHTVGFWEIEYRQSGGVITGFLLLILQINNLQIFHCLSLYWLLFRKSANI